MVYPDSISRRLGDLRHSSPKLDAGAAGKDVNFACGSFVRLSLVIDDGVVTSATFSSNGCGFMLVAADILADRITGRPLTELHGLSVEGLRDHLIGQTEEIPACRSECIETCTNALRGAFAQYRISQIEEFRGEKALICTCFGVTEERVEMIVADASVETVGDVTRMCRAGGGCGSCTMMIQELLDHRINAAKDHSPL